MVIAAIQNIPIPLAHCQTKSTKGGSPSRILPPFGNDIPAGAMPSLVIDMYRSRAEPRRGSQKKAPPSLGRAFAIPAVARDIRRQRE